MLLTKVCTKFATVGFHRWPEAPDNVAYLRSMHRHLFNFNVAIQVLHPDRSLEFHTLSEELDILHQQTFS